MNSTFCCGLPRGAPPTAMPVFWQYRSWDIITEPSTECGNAGHYAIVILPWSLRPTTQIITGIQQHDAVFLMIKTNFLRTINI